MNTQDLPKKKKSRLWSWGGWLALGFLGLSALGIFQNHNQKQHIEKAQHETVRTTTQSGSINTYDLRDGDCFRTTVQPRDTEADPQVGVPKVTLADCSSAAWDYKAATSFLLPDGSYPGFTAIQTKADSTCGPASKNGRTLWLYPSAESWKVGDRKVTCLFKNPVAP